MFNLAFVTIVVSLIVLAAVLMWSDLRRLNGDHMRGIFLAMIILAVASTFIVVELFIVFEWQTSIPSIIGGVVLWAAVGVAMLFGLKEAIDLLLAVFDGYVD